MELGYNNFIKSKINTKLLKILTILLLSLILFGVNNTSVYYASLTPFGVGLVFALLYIKFNGYILSLVYAFSYILLLRFSLADVLHIINVSAVLCIMEFAIYKKNLHVKKWQTILGVFLSMIAFAICNSCTLNNLLATLVSIILGFLFFYSALIFLDSSISNEMYNKINLDEKVCGSVVLIIFAIGISRASIGVVSLGLLFGGLIVLLATKLCKTSSSIILSAILGIGFAISTMDIQYISIFVLLSLVALIFKGGWRCLSSIAVVLTYIIYCFFFGCSLVWKDLLSLGIGCTLFCFVPIKSLCAAANVLTSDTQVAYKKMFIFAKDELVLRVKNLSNIFLEMDRVYRDMVRGNLSHEQAKELLKEETIASVCKNCANYNYCFRCSGTFMNDCLNTVIDVGLNKSKVLLIDIPEFMTTNCNNVNKIIYCVNSLVSAYSEYATAVSNIDTSRILIADQLSGVSGLLTSLAKEIDLNLNEDNKFNELLKERLGYAGILCLEALVYEKGINNKLVALIVKTSHVNGKNIVNIVNKTLKCGFYINKIEATEVAGASLVWLRNRPPYDIAFGSAFLTKNGKVVSGDNHSIIKVDEGKYLMSLCDGMGSGKSANKISRLTLDLIENFYRAGFDNDVILSSVNKLLSLNEQENFSTIDLCAIDCYNRTYDFIKLGASAGYIKRANGDVEVISSSGLPVGVLEDICPHITKKYINPMDIIVLVSDGVSDVLLDELKTIILNSDSINPQSLAEEILNTALLNSSGIASDDMTVICVRVFDCL